VARWLDAAAPRGVLPPARSYSACVPFSALCLENGTQIDGKHHAAAGYCHKLVPSLVFFSETEISHKSAILADS
jgi:hypothetical protein